jgi:predicted nucleic acid-binding protein
MRSWHGGSGRPDQVSLYLADSSIWIGQNRPDAGDLRRRLVERLSRGEIATCVPVALEVLVGSANAQAYARDWVSFWQHLFWLPLHERATGRALEVQMELAQAAPGGHQLGPMSFLIAACAEVVRGGVVLWHCDEGMAAICEHTGQPYESELTTGPSADGTSRRRRATRRRSGRQPIRRA